MTTAIEPIEITRDLTTAVVEMDGRAKRVYGSGSVERCRTRFRARIRNPDKTKTTLGVFDTEQEAQSVLDGFCEAAARNLVVAGAPTLRSFGKTFLEERETLEKCKGIRSDKSRWENWILASEFADLPLDEITDKAVRDWIKWMLTQPIKRRRGGAGKRPRCVSPTTVDHCLDLLRVALNKAKLEKFVSVNVTDGVEVPGLDEPDWDWLRLEDQAKWERANTKPFLKYVVMFAYGAGLRRGDLWNLKLTDLHLDAAQPYVTFKMQKRKPGKKPKWVTVPLFGAALRALRAWLPLLPEYCPENPLGLVWPARDGCQRVAALKRWSETRRKVGISRHIKWHELRHTFGSSLVSGIWGRAWRLEEVRDVMGHSSVTVTERYAHLAPAKVLEAGTETNAPLPLKPSTPDAMATASSSEQLAPKLAPRSGRGAPQPLEIIGAPSMIRTCDPWFRRPMLYPAELWAPDVCGALLSLIAGARTQQNHDLATFFRVVFWPHRPELARELTGREGEGTHPQARKVARWAEPCTLRP